MRSECYFSIHWLVERPSAAKACHGGARKTAAEDGNTGAEPESEVCLEGLQGPKEGQDILGNSLKQTTRTKTHASSKWPAPCSVQQELHPACGPALVRDGFLNRDSHDDSIVLLH